VRLAQRVPVRIALDRADERNELVAGATATVEVLGSPPPGDTGKAGNRQAASRHVGCYGNGLSSCKVELQ
jgi:multidrug resistance efflux pump